VFEMPRHRTGTSPLVRKIKEKSEGEKTDGFWKFKLTNFNNTVIHIQCRISSVSQLNRYRRYNALSENSIDLIVHLSRSTLKISHNNRGYDYASVSRRSENNRSDANSQCHNVNRYE